jgi:nitrogen fixation NifU-like protein
MNDLRELYQEVILDHNRKPRNFRGVAGANRTAEGHNPLCGDHIALALRVEDGMVRDAAFQGAGCAISKASASMMTDSIIGKPVADAEVLLRRMHAMLTAAPDAAEAAGGDLGKLVVFGGVREFPARVKCATLPWHALGAALSGTGGSVSTEEDRGERTAVAPDGSPSDSM